MLMYWQNVANWIVDQSTACHITVHSNLYSVVCNCFGFIYRNSLGSRIRDVDVFWYKTEIKSVYFLQLCFIALIVCDFMVYPDPKCFIFKTKNGLIYFSEDEGWFFLILCYRLFFLRSIAQYFTQIFMNCFISS